MADLVNFNSDETRPAQPGINPADADMVLPEQPKETPQPPKMPANPIITPQGHRKLRNLLIAILLLVLCVGGGIFGGIKLSEHFMLNKDDTSQYGPQTPTGDIHTIAQISAVAPKTTTIPSDDNLTLAFLKLHNDNTNSCYSPLSIRYALEMLRAGAKSNTRTQIDQLLGKTAAKRYGNIPDHLAIANSLWVKTGLENSIKPSYTSYLKNNFGAAVKVDSFENAANLNSWIKDNTLDLLDNVLSDEDVRGLTAALINVLAIDMEWQQDFDPLMTEGELFGDLSSIDLQGDLDPYLYTTMENSFAANANSNISYYYNFADQATVFANDLKDYNGTKLQFVAIMPDNLSAFINNTNIAEINNLISGLNVAKPKNNNFIFNFKVYIPKFSINGGTETFINDLKELGIKDAFDEQKANFSELTNDPFFIDGGVHKTKFDFNEEGIKAAAVTTLGGKGSTGGPGLIPSSIDLTVSINRPFLYLVRDVDSGDIWFAGTVYQPNKWNDDKSQYHNQ